MLRTALVLSLVLLPVLALAPTAALADGDEGGAAPPAPAEDAAARERIPVEDFLRWSERKIGWDLVWDGRDKVIRGREVEGVTLPDDVAEAERLARGVLSFLDLVMIPIGASDDRRDLVADARRPTSIVKLKPERVRMTEQNVDIIETQDGRFLTTVIALHPSVDVRNLRNAATRLASPNNVGHVTELTSPPSLVVTDFAPNLAAIYRNVQRINATAAETAEARRVEIVRLRHAHAHQVANLVQSVLVTPGTQPASSAPQGAGGPAAAPPLRVQADQRLNQVLVAGSAAQVEAVLRLVEAMDRPTPEPEATPDMLVHVVRLESLEAAPTAQTLQTLIHSTSAWGPRRPSLVPNPATNSLVVASTAEAWKKLERVIAELEAAARARHEAEAADVRGAFGGRGGNRDDER